MKTNTNFLLLNFIAIAFLSIGCFSKENLTNPNFTNRISGIVIDSLSRLPISEATIFVTYTHLGTTTEEEEVQIIKTDTDGTFTLYTSWDEVFIQIQKKGFATVSASQVVNDIKEVKNSLFVLSGRSEVYTEFIENPTLRYESNEVSQVIIEVRDLYNENKQNGTQAFVHFYDIESQLNVGAVELIQKSATPTFTMLKSQISANMFPAPQKGQTVEYGYYYEIKDPDENITEYGLEEKEMLGKLRIIG